MRPREGEVFVDFVGNQPQIAPAADFGDAGDLFVREHGPGRVVRAIDPNNPRARRDRAGDAVEIGMKAALGRERHRHDLGTARGDDTLVGGVERLGHDNLVAGAGDALQCAIKPALGARRRDDILGGAGLAGAIGEALGDRRAQLRIADRRGVAGAAAA
jgi:hypothetical protein